GLAFFEMGNGLTVVEDIHEGLYQVFETDPEAGQAAQKVEAKICTRNVFPSGGQKTAQLGQ
ncbi:hypothetical protein Q6264_29430, partial [Klebsiella pneumoniae]|uniref:hypothetical protein n=1 Tax=Klebsiella pneumoniae TaxID=573 RepID=UPI002730CDCF